MANCIYLRTKLRFYIKFLPLCSAKKIPHHLSSGADVIATLGAYVNSTEYDLLHFFSGITRVVGNRKGLLTRQRQPKMAAHLIRDRYMSLMTGQYVCRL